RPKTIAAVEIFPTIIRDSAGIFLIAHPGTIVLKTTVDLVRVLVVDADVIELADREVICLPPLVATVITIPEATVVAPDDIFRVGRVDPYVMPVTVRSARCASK